jgi:hypothetical protein
MRTLALLIFMALAQHFYRKNDKLIPVVIGKIIYIKTSRPLNSIP